MEKYGRPDFPISSDAGLVEARQDLEGMPAVSS